MKEIFENEIKRLMEDAKINGKKEITIVSGDIHRLVGGYPGKNHRMPVCCKVMRNLMRSGDEILFQTPAGQSSTLKIKYYL